MRNLSKKHEADLEELRKLSIEDLKQFGSFLGPQPSEVSGWTLYKAIGRIQKEKDIPKRGIVIQTDCEEEKQVIMSQPPSRIFLNGKLIWEAS